MGSNSAKSTDPDSMGGMRYAAMISDTSWAIRGTLFRFFTRGMSLDSPAAMIFRLISTILSSFLLNSGFSTSGTAGKILAVVRFVCREMCHKMSRHNKSRNSTGFCLSDRLQGQLCNEIFFMHTKIFLSSHKHTASVGLVSGMLFC